MPTWGAILAEIVAELELDAANPPGPGGISGQDRVRERYLAALAQQTGRPAILYAASYLEGKQNVPASLVMIGLGDMPGFMECVSGLPRGELDLILHTPGGDLAATESIVAYLRSRFDHIRVFVPLAAMSAGTMLALSADEIVMGSHSQLGPIDPQFTVQSPEGLRSAPAQSILDQFELAKQECQDPANVAAWLPMLRALLPGLIPQCLNQQKMAQDFVAGALKKYMLVGDPNGSQLADDAAAWFNDHNYFKTHGRRVSRDDARALGLTVTDLEDDHALQDAVLSIFHASVLTFSQTSAFKLVESSAGRRWIQSATVQVHQIHGQQPQPVPAGQTAAPWPKLAAKPQPTTRQKRKRR